MTQAGGCVNVPTRLRHRVFWIRSAHEKTRDRNLPNSGCFFRSFSGLQTSLTRRAATNSGLRLGFRFDFFAGLVDRCAGHSNFAFGRDIAPGVFLGREIFGAIERLLPSDFLARVG
jgi:hypothetical protein